MDTKSNFKQFVKNHPELIKYVKNGNKTWQNFYELYDLYGENSQVWDEYLIASASTFDMLGFLKNIDLDSVQEGVNSLQRVLGLLQDIKTPVVETPKPRPIYKHFED